MIFRIGANCTQRRGYLLKSLLATFIFAIVAVSPAQADTIPSITAFPPSNCINGLTMFMGWDGIHSTSCYTGQEVLAKALSPCSDGQEVAYKGGKYVCRDTVSDCAHGRGYACSLLGQKEQNTLELYTTTDTSSNSAHSPWHIMFHNDIADSNGYLGWGMEASYAGDFRIGRSGDSTNETYPFRIEPNGDVEIGHTNLKNNLIYNGIRFCPRMLSEVLVLAQCP